MTLGDLTRTKLSGHAFPPKMRLRTVDLRNSENYAVSLSVTTRPSHWRLVGARFWRDAVYAILFIF